MTASVILHFHRMGHVYAEKGKGDWGCQYPIFCIRWVNNAFWVNYIPFNLSLQNLNVLFPVRILQVAGFVADVLGMRTSQRSLHFQRSKEDHPLPPNRLKCKLLYEGFVSAHRDYSYTRVSRETRGHLDPASSSISAIKKHKRSPPTLVLLGWDMRQLFWIKFCQFQFLQSYIENL